MTESGRNIDDLLLELHLNRIGAQDRLLVERALEQDSGLQRKSDRLRRALRPLDYWPCGQAPPRLVERVLAAVAPAEDRSDHAPPARPDGGGRQLRFPLRDAIGVAACLALLVSVAVPGLGHVRDRARRAHCASNLGSVFQGVKLYQASFAGSLPFAGISDNASWLPNGNEGVPFASNSRHVFLVAKHNFGPTPANFLCPSSGQGEPMRPDELADRSDFASRACIGYDTLNLSGRNPNLRPQRAIAYMGDANPLFRDGRFDQSIDPEHTNSPSHGGAGQTVLTLDGSAVWTESPILGVARDNVWLAGNIRRYTGVESPSRDDDAQLVPGYPVTDRRVQELLRH